MAPETEVANPINNLSEEQLEELGRKFDELHEQVRSDLGDRDARYIRGIIDLHRRLGLLGRVLLIGSRFRPAWIAGTATLGMAKILENMEIGHNVLHGQWDWMNDPVINSSEWDWDTASTSEAWKHSHNYIHHTYTNIRGKDKDLGYEIMRIDPHQEWHPAYLLQPIYNLILMALFEWGVALHDMDFEAIRSGEKSQKQVLKDLNGIFYKARLQVTKDYIAWPFVSGLVMTLIDLGLSAAGVKLPEAAPRNETRAQKARRKLGRTRRRATRKIPSRSARIETVVRDLVARKSFREPFKRTLWANVTANIIRNVWAYAIIFCGHFPDQTYTFSQEETEDESTGRRYVRQLIGAANIEGSPLFHVISGNLGYQVEHHLYPDMPSTRYGEIAPRVREICKEYDLPYNSGPFFQQIGMVQRTILRLAFPGGKPRPKPGPYRGEAIKTAGERDLQTVASSNGGS
jgi:NADPH-dependent stearoyl-CoA 9-desaturase